MLLIIGTSSLFNNVMQTVHELVILLQLHWANITLHLDLVYVVILLTVLVLKKRQLLVLCGSTRSYIYLTGSQILGSYTRVFTVFGQGD